MEAGWALKGFCWSGILISRIFEVDIAQCCALVKWWKRFLFVALVKVCRLDTTSCHIPGAFIKQSTMYLSHTLGITMNLSNAVPTALVPQFSSHPLLPRPMKY